MAGRTVSRSCARSNRRRGPTSCTCGTRSACSARSRSAFLIPDNHIGRATVSSVAVAHEVERMGGRSIACLNARDRNLLGFRRDLLTAAAYGVDQFLFVYGDRPTLGARTGQLTVQSMMRRAAHVPGDARRHDRRARSAPESRPAPARCRRGSATPTSCSRRCASRSTSCSSGAPASSSTVRSTRASWSCRARRWRARSAPTSRSSRSRTRGCARSSAIPRAGVELACDLVMGIRDVGHVRRRASDPREPVPRGRRAARDALRVAGPRDRRLPAATCCAASGAQALRALDASANEIHCNAPTSPVMSGASVETGGRQPQLMMRTFTSRFPEPRYATSRYIVCEPPSEV